MKVDCISYLTLVAIHDETNSEQRRLFYAKKSQQQSNFQVFNYLRT